MPGISQPTQRLLQDYRAWYGLSKEKEGIPTIHVDEVASRVAVFYEKIRGVLDWREEHLLRRTAIERILKRRLFLKKSGENIAEPLVSELIRGGHFPNDAIPEARIIEVQNLVDKYIFILDNAPAPPKEKMKIQLYDWMMGVAACDLEATLAPPARETALIEYMFELMREQIDVRNGLAVSKPFPEEERITQIYIAVQRALFKLDSPIISFNLLKKWYTDWSNLPRETLGKITENIYPIWGKIEEALRYPLSEKFYNICERYDTPYLILGDIISKDPQQAGQTLQKPEVLESEIREAYHKRLKKIKEKMGRAAFYSTASIFLTKIIFAFMAEVPFDKYITKQFDYFTIGTSILIPPLLMFFLVLTIRPPSRQNAELVVMEVMKIVQERERKDIYEIRPARKRGLISNSMIVLFYLLSFVASFSLIIWGLNQLHFSILSIIIFLLFFSLISFAGVKIRQRAKELVVEKEKETFLFTLLDAFSLPFIRVGKWLSSQWLKYNVWVVIFNSLLDMPLQGFIEFFEQWRAFLREKKEEIH